MMYYVLYIVTAIGFGWLVHKVIDSVNQLKKANSRLSKILDDNGETSFYYLQTNLDVIESVIECDKTEIEELEKCISKQKSEIISLENKISHLQNKKIGLELDSLIAKNSFEKIHQVLFEAGIIKEELSEGSLADAIERFVSDQFEMAKSIKEILELYSLTE